MFYLKLKRDNLQGNSGYCHFDLFNHTKLVTQYLLKDEKRQIVFYFQVVFIS